MVIMLLCKSKHCHQIHCCLQLEVTSINSFNYESIFNCRSHLYGLSVVNLDHVEAETVHPFPGGHKYAPGWIKVAPNVY